LVPESLGPLQKLEVILHLAFNERFDGNEAVDVVFGKTACEEKRLVGSRYKAAALTLEYLEVLEVCIFRVDIELDPRHRDIL
jgi:hypothetical protein